MGPAILGCCYEVGGDVVSALQAVCGAPDAYVDGTASRRTTVDLHAALRAQLAAAGVPAASIHAAPFCTRCRTDLFFSFRAEGEACGRLMAAIGPSGGP
jgi:copper oxidase (laccase) domain-containing protein